MHAVLLQNNDKGQKEIKRGIEEYNNDIMHPRYVVASRHTNTACAGLSKENWRVNDDNYNDNIIIVLQWIS